MRVNSFHLSILLILFISCSHSTSKHKRTPSSEQPARSLISKWHEVPDLNFHHRFWDRVRKLRQKEELNLPLNGPTIFVSNRRRDIDNGNYQENSLPSFNHTIVQLEAKYLEIDIIHSSDGVGFLFHDNKFKRWAKSREGKSFPLNSKISFFKWEKVGKNYEFKKREKLTNLSSLLHLFKPLDVHFYIEFKEKPLEESLKVIQGTRAKKETSPMAFNWGCLREVKDFFYKEAPFTYFSISGREVYFPGTINGINVMGLASRGIGFWQDLKANKACQIRNHLLKGVDFVTTDRFKFCRKIANDQYQRLNSIEI